MWNDYSIVRPNWKHDNVIIQGSYKCGLCNVHKENTQDSCYKECTKCSKSSTNDKHCSNLDDPKVLEWCQKEYWGHSQQNLQCFRTLHCILFSPRDESGWQYKWGDQCVGCGENYIIRDEERYFWNMNFLFWIYEKDLLNLEKQKDSFDKLIDAISGIDLNCNN